MVKWPFTWLIGNQKVTLNHLEFSSGTRFFDLRHNHGRLVRWFQLNLKHIRQTEILSPCWVQHTTSLKPPDCVHFYAQDAWRRTARPPHTSEIYPQLLAGPSATLDDKTHLKNYHIPYDPCRVYLPAFGWFMVNVGKYTSPMDPIGIPVVWKKNKLTFQSFKKMGWKTKSKGSESEGAADSDLGLSLAVFSCPKDEIPVTSTVDSTTQILYHDPIVGVLIVIFNHPIIFMVQIHISTQQLLHYKPLIEKGPWGSILDAFWHPPPKLFTWIANPNICDHQARQDLPQQGMVAKAPWDIQLNKRQFLWV